MTVQDIEHTAKTPLHDLESAAEFETGLAKLTPYLRAFARSLCGRADLGEDLSQSSLAKAWQARRSFVSGSNLKAWLFTILRNEFYSYQRRAWRQMPWDDKFQNDPICASSGEQEWSAELSDTVRAIRSLPGGQRDALILVGVGGASYEHSAALLGIAVGTMKSRVARARESLKESLDSRKKTAALVAPGHWQRHEGNPRAIQSTHQINSRPARGGQFAIQFCGR